jgi:hypothetical protein
MKPQHFASEAQTNDAIQAEHARIGALMTERYHQRVAYTRSMPIDPSLVLPLNSLARTCNEALSLIRAHSAEQSLTATAGASVNQSAQNQLVLQQVMQHQQGL